MLVNAIELINKRINEVLARRKAAGQNEKRSNKNTRRVKNDK